MATLTININDTLEADLQTLATHEGVQASDFAARLLARAVRAAKQRPVFDMERLKAYAAQNKEEEEALADADWEHRAELLAQEDAA